LTDKDHLLGLNEDDKFIEILSASGVTSHLSVSLFTTSLLQPLLSVEFHTLCGVSCQVRRVITLTYINTFTERCKGLIASS